MAQSGCDGDVHGVEAQSHRVEHVRAGDHDGAKMIGECGCGKPLERGGPSLPSARDHSLSPESTLAPAVEQAEEQDREEDPHVQERDEAFLFEDDRPGIHEGHLHVEGEEE